MGTAGLNGGGGVGRHRSTLAGHPTVGKVLPSFIARLPGYVAQLKRGVDSGDWEGILSLVHQLKGSGTSYGFAAITEQCGAIEQAIARGDATRQVRGLIEYLEHVEGYESRGEATS